ncbi:MAG: DAK2 domain-containing protein [Ruminococcaceae bacterium]|nr:DAK2 domain-containing protein [Oscillospiraceae bacterium]
MLILRRTYIYGDVMSTTILDGKKLKSMLIGGAENIRSNLAEINDLNVFPVPDGDTGTNMTKTIEGGICEIAESEIESVGDVMKKFAHGMLLGARGNSGVILSQIFSGITDALEGLDSVTAVDLLNAYRSGIEKSYHAVTNPTEGTILTVFRESTEYAGLKIDENSSVDDFFRLHIEEAERSLARTKELLPVLAEADVVDSGGAGYLCIAVGMYSSLTGKIKIDSYKFNGEKQAHNVDINRFTRDSILEFGYCTEILLRLMNAKVDPDTFDKDIIINELESLGGESIVAVKDGDVVKIHVHTFFPGGVMAICQKYGEFLTVKVENMSLDHTGSSDTPKKKPATPKKPYSVVTVASGEGLCALLSDMGADEIICGGQTANPSTEEFIDAFEKCNSEHIIVLPNNKNVFLAAQQASEIWQNGFVHIVPTKSIMQGYSALSVITPGITDIDSLVAGAIRAAESVVSSEITRAVRDAVIGGVSINKDDYIAITDGAITATASCAEDALVAMLQALDDMDEREIITVFVGAHVSDAQRVELTEKLEVLYPDCEVTTYIGGQEIYDYYVAIE